MSKSSFHSLYLAPIVVAIATAIIGVVIPRLFSSSPAGQTESVPQRVPPSSPEKQILASTAPPKIEYPKDADTKAIVKAYLDDHAAADVRFDGTEVEICSVVASIETAQDVELYGAVLDSKVEGLYFKCHFDTQVEPEKLERNRLVRIKGIVAGYTYHPKSPSIALISCRVVSQSRAKN